MFTNDEKNTLRVVRRFAAVFAVVVIVTVMASCGFGGSKGGGEDNEEVTFPEVEAQLPDGAGFDEGETVELSADEPVAEFSNGVVVDFGEQGLYTEGTMSVRETEMISQDNYKCKYYDFIMDGNEHTDLPMLVKVSLPLEKGCHEGNVSVRSWDEKLGWVPVFSEVDESSRKVTFYPEHFSVYSLFVEAGKQKNLSAYENKPLFRYLDEHPTLNSRVYLDEYALASRIKMRKSTSDVMASSWLGQYDSEKKNSQFALGLKALGSWAGPLGDLSDVAGGGLVVLGEGESALADNIGNFGTALTVIQLFGSYYRTGSILETAYENWDALAKMGADYILKKAGLSTGWLAVVYVAYLGAKKTKACIDFTLRLEAKDDIEFGYQQFTYKYVFVNTNNGRVEEHYDPRGDENDVWTEFLATTNCEADEVRLLPITKTTIGGAAVAVEGFSSGAEANWGLVLKNLANATKSNNPSALMNRIDRMIDDYCRAFWKLSPKKKNEFLKRQGNYAGSKTKLSEVWKEPSSAKREEYIASMKQNIYAANKDVIKNLLDKSYVEMVNNVYREAVILEHELNETLTFSLKGDFDNPLLKDADIRIRQYAFKDKDDFRFTKENNYTVTCSRFAWLQTMSNNNYPKFLDIVKGNNRRTITFQYKFPHTVIEVTEDDRVGKIDDFSAQAYVTNMSSSFGSSFNPDNSDERIVASVNVKNGMLTIQIPAHQRTKDFSPTNGAGTYSTPAFTIEGTSPWINDTVQEHQLSVSPSKLHFSYYYRTVTAYRDHEAGFLIESHDYNVTHNKTRGNEGTVMLSGKDHSIEDVLVSFPVTTNGKYTHFDRGERPIVFNRMDINLKLVNPIYYETDKNGYNRIISH